MYANKSFKSILEVGGYDFNDDPFNDHLKRALANCMIRKFTGYNAVEDQKTPDVSNIWSFISKNEKGATYQLESRANAYDPERP